MKKNTKAERIEKQAAELAAKVRGIETRKVIEHFQDSLIKDELANTEKYVADINKVFGPLETNIISKFLIDDADKGEFTLRYECEIEIKDYDSKVLEFLDGIEDGNIKFDNGVATITANNSWDIIEDVEQTETTYKLKIK